MLFTVAWCFNTRFLESNNMHGLEIRMCVFNHIIISIFTIRAGVFTRFYAYRVTSVNLPPPPPPTCKKNKHHFQYTVSLFFSVICDRHQNIATWTEKTKQKFIIYRKFRYCWIWKKIFTLMILKKTSFKISWFTIAYLLFVINI